MSNDPQDNGTGTDPAEGSARTSEDTPSEPGKELVVSTRRGDPRPVIYFGGNTDRAPTRGTRKALYELNLPLIHSLNLGPTVKEIIELERLGCIANREELRRVSGALCIGFFSGKGGPGKSTLATLIHLLLYYMNPVRDRVILIDVNTSQTTLHALNGLKKEDFLTGKFWTMETLYDFLVQHHDLDKLEFDEINAKLAYRENPQLPVIPLMLTASAFEEDESKFTGEQYLLVLEILKRFFTIIVHDFGIEPKVKLTRVALAQQHMLGLLTHSGRATTEMVGDALEMLHLNLYGLLVNTVVALNMKQRPTRDTLRAIALEKAGKNPKYQNLLGKLSPQERSNKEIQTPGQALEVINGIIGLRKLLDPLTLDDISLLNFDDHLSVESCLYLDHVSETVQAQLWTILNRMLSMRVEFERNFLEELPDSTSLRREQMVVTLDEDGEEVYTIVSLPADRRAPAGAEAPAGPSQP
jgi:MinD-like ATPase involved in chromosome partitioning or flagellar assembly